MLLWMALALGASPLEVNLTEAEKAQLSAGDVVVRYPTDSGLVVGAIDIPASREQVMKTVMDFDARVKSVGAIDAIETYAPATDPKGLGAKFTLSIVGTEIVYYIRYDVADEGVNFALDKEQTNDLVDSSGGYWTYPEGDEIRLVYWSKTDTGRSIPRFIRNTLSVRSFRNQLTSMKELAPKK